MERLVSTCEKLNDTRRQLERAIAGIEGPLHIVQECLYHREKRQGNVFILSLITYTEISKSLNIFKILATIWRTF